MPTKRGIGDGECMSSIAAAAGFRSHKGETDGSDLVEIEVPRDSRKAKLTLWVAGQPLHPDDDGPHLEYDVDLGHLAPLDTLRGVQGRLLNLGYPPGKLVNDEAAKPDAPTTAAISAYQQARGKQATGKPEDVRADLAGAHDG